MNLTRKEKQILLMGLKDDRWKDRKVYEKYYRTAHWKAKREEKLTKDPICQLCRYRKATQVHHKNYTFFQEHLDRDLDSVCKPCHRKIS